MTVEQKHQNTEVLRTLVVLAGVNFDFNVPAWKYWYASQKEPGLARCPTRLSNLADAAGQPTVAILGASADRHKFGNKSLRAHQRPGYAVFAVNPKGGQIEGLPVYARLADVPVAHLDRVSVYLPPPATLAALDEIAAKGCDELWLNPGTSSPR